MKREYNEAKKYVDPIWPIFFWHRCVSCNQEFRREWGWCVYRSLSGFPIDVSICGNCAKTEQEAYQRVSRPVRPIADPPPQE